MAGRLDLWWPFDRLAFADAERRLTNDQSLARIRFLNHAWGNAGVLPLDADQLSHISRFKPKVWLAVMGEFTHTPDGWVHEILAAETKRAIWISEKRAEAGRKGGRTGKQLLSNSSKKSKQLLSHACDVDVSVSSVVSEPSERGSASKEDSREVSVGKTTAKVVPLRSEG